MIGLLKVLSIVCTVMTNPDDDEKAIFLEKLGILRQQATAYLDILNDIRKKTSKLTPESATAAHYKYITTPHSACRKYVIGFLF